MTSNFSEIEGAFALTSVKLIDKADENWAKLPHSDVKEELKHLIVGSFHFINNVRNIQQIKQS